MYTEKLKAIDTIIRNYFEGIFYGDIAKLASAFHDNVVLYGDIKGVDYSKGLEEYLEGVGQRQSPKDLGETFGMEIIGIDIMGKIAMAKLHLPMLGYNYYDYLSLVQINGEWKIVNKIFTHVD